MNAMNASTASVPFYR